MGTFKERLEKEHPERVSDKFKGGCDKCPIDYGYEKPYCDIALHDLKFNALEEQCVECWNSEEPVKVKPLTANEYQKLAARTINRELTDYQRKMHALHGLAGEVGELHSLFQKEYQGHPFDEEHAMKEAGDCLWMLAEFIGAYGCTLEDVMRTNIEKLEARFPNGFEAEKSLHRKEGDI